MRYFAWARSQMGTGKTHLFLPCWVLGPGAAAHAKDAERHQTRRKRTLEQGAAVAPSRQISLRIVVRCVRQSDADAVRGEQIVIKRGLHVHRHWGLRNRTTCAVSHAGRGFSHSRYRHGPKKKNQEESSLNSSHILSLQCVTHRR